MFQTIYICVNDQVPRSESRCSWTADQFYSSASLKWQKQCKPGVNFVQKNIRENASEELQAYDNNNLSEHKHEHKSSPAIN